MSSNLRFLLNTAIQEFNRGNLKNAKEFILKSLQLKSRNIEAYNILGVINAMQGDYAGAINSFNQAIKFDKNNYLANFNLGKVYLENNELSNAAYHCERSIQLQPNNPEAWLNLGIVKLNSGEYIESIEKFNTALSLNSKFVAAYINKGTALHYLGKFEEAIINFENSIEIDPKSAEGYFNKASVLMEIGNLEEAYRNFEISSEIHVNPFESISQMAHISFLLKNYNHTLNIINKLLNIDNKNIKLLSIKGECLLQIKEYDYALDIFESLLKIDSRKSEIWESLAKIHYIRNSLNDALSCYESALKCNQYSFIAYTGKGLIYRDQAQYKNAYENYAAAKNINPYYPEANYFEGLLNLELHNFELGWNGYAYRWNISERVQESISTNKKIWSGENGVIYIWYEQGIGDQILYSSIFNDFNLLNNKFIVKVDSRLLGIYRRSFPEIIFVSEYDEIEESQYDYHCPMGELGKIFRPTISKFTGLKDSYFSSQKVIFDEIKELKKLGKLICGISWISTNDNDGVYKSIELNKIINSLDNNDVNFVSLQYGNTEKEISNLDAHQREKIRILNQLDLTNDFESLCSLIDSCDIVITVSNSIAHFCGALGKRTLLITPKSRGKFWYWSEFEGHSLFYNSVQVISQQNDGNWDEALTEVASKMRYYNKK